MQGLNVRMNTPSLLLLTNERDIDGNIGKAKHCMALGDRSLARRNNFNTQAILQNACAPTVLLPT